MRLLEGKHLYQSVRIDRDAVLAEAKDLGFLEGARTEAPIDQALNSEWFAHDQVSVQRPGYAMPDGAEPPPSIGFFFKGIKAACASCKTIVPMNLMLSLDLFKPQDRFWPGVEAPASDQDFVFLFQCQFCKTTPDAFLVRRRGLKLTLCGRAPMEIVDVPQKVVPGATKSLANRDLRALAYHGLVRESSTEREIRVKPGSEELGDDLTRQWRPVKT